MKKLGIILLFAVLWMGVNAETKTSKQDSVNAEVSNDSLQKLYMNDRLDPKESILLQKLSPDQIMLLEKQRLDNDKINDMPFSKLGLFVLSISPFLMAILIIYFVGLYKNKESVRKHEFYMKALEAGQTIPENYFKEPEKPKSSNLQKGAIWLAVGLGLTILLLVKGDTKESGVGAIPIFVGVAYLLVYYLEKPKKQLPEGNE